MSRQAEQKPQNVAAQGSVVAGMTLLSRISGLARDMVLSYVFGASGTADAFFVAFRIPNFFRRLFAEGAFNQAFIPVLARYRSLPRATLLDFVSIMSGNLGVVLLIVVVLGVVFTPALVVVFAPGFWAKPEQFELTRDLVRITFPYLGFISLAALSSSLLNSHHKYAVPAFTPVLLNISLLSAALLAAASTAVPVFALAWGVLFAGVAQLLFQLPWLAKLGLLVRPRIGVGNEGVQRVGKLLLPAIFASSVGQINALIDTMLASTLITGSISWLYYSDRLLELPIGLVAVALGTVLLPNLSRLDGEKNPAGFRATLSWGVRVGSFFGIPAAFALFALALPLICSIFMHGALTDTDARMAALSLEVFAVGALPLVLVKVLAPAYFAQEDTRSPFRAGVVAVAVNIVINLALFRFLGHVGLAWGTSIAAWVNMLLLARGLVRSSRLTPDRQLAGFVLRSVFAASLMAWLLITFSPPAEAWLTAPLVDRSWWLMALIGAGGACYFAVMLACGVRTRHLLHHA